MSWMRWFFKKKGNSINMVQDATAISGLLDVAGAATFTGGMCIGGVNYFASDGTPESAVVAVRKGDHCTDYTNGNEYIFAGTAGTSTGWKLVTRAG